MESVFPLFGFGEEQKRLEEALRKRESLVILGAAGAGKTALIEAVVAGSANHREFVRTQYSSNLHRLLIDLTRSLLDARHKTLRLRARPTPDTEKWLAGQTSIHLKGLLWTSLEAQPLTIVLDGIDGGSFPMYRFLQRLYFAPGVAIVAAARDTGSLGVLSRLFWDPRKMIHLRALNHADARRLFDLAASRYGLEQFELNEFREKVLESAQGNPGEIIEMCRLAANPAYISGKHIKFAPLRIDAMMRFLPTAAGQRLR